MDKIILKSGKEFDSDYFVAMPNGLMFMAILGGNPIEVLASFMDSSETASVTYGERVFENCSFVGFEKESEERYKITLRRA